MINLCQIFRRKPKDRRLWRPGEENTFIKIDFKGAGFSEWTGMNWLWARIKLKGLVLVKKIFKLYVPEAPISFSKKKILCTIALTSWGKALIINSIVLIYQHEQHMNMSFQTNFSCHSFTKDEGVCSFSRDLRRPPWSSARSTVTYKEINRQLTAHYHDLFNEQKR